MTFEIDNDYITLVKNAKIMKNPDELSELSHLLDKKMKLDQLAYELRYSGILICPDENDIKYVGYTLKNKVTVERTIENIVLACRCFSIKSHNLNKHISDDIITMMVKQNPENDDYFYDDEPKDWFELGVFKDKIAFGKAQEVKYKDDLLENQLIEDFKDEELFKKIDFLYNRPGHDNICTLIEGHEDFTKFYPKVSEYKIQIGFLNNLRNFIRMTYITNFP